MALGSMKTFRPQNKSAPSNTHPTYSVSITSHKETITVIVRATLDSLMLRSPNPRNPSLHLTVPFKLATLGRSKPAFQAASRLISPMTKPVERIRSQVGDCAVCRSATQGPCPPSRCLSGATIRYFPGIIVTSWFSLVATLLFPCA